MKYNNRDGDMNLNKKIFLQKRIVVHYWYYDHTTILSPNKQLFLLHFNFLLPNWHSSYTWIIKLSLKKYYAWLIILWKFIIDN